MVRYFLCHTSKTCGIYVVPHNHNYLFRSKFPWTSTADVSRPEADVEMQDRLVWLEKEDGKWIFSVDGLDFKKYL